MQVGAMRCGTIIPGGLTSNQVKFLEANVSGFMLPRRAIENSCKISNFESQRHRVIRGIAALRTDKQLLKKNTSLEVHLSDVVEVSVGNALLCRQLGFLIE